jgi:hypothetical protein
VAASGSDPSAAFERGADGAALAVTIAATGNATPAAHLSRVDERPWARSFGKHWKIDVAVMAAIVFLFGAVRPLADPDLPMHLSIGEWILRHHAFPSVEPFTWTAAGQPYFAYSWLPQTLYYAVFQSFGHLGLRALQGCMVLGSALAALVLARAARLRPAQGIILAGFNLIVGAFFVAMLRPQSMLLITLPVVWAACLRLSTGRAGWPQLVVLFGASALTANSHLFFPATLAPVMLFWVHRSHRRGVGAAAVASIVAGWLASPYALAWPRVFAHNFAPHILTRPPSAITELQPGFLVALQPPLGPMLLLVAAMLALPWVLERSAMSRREWLLSAVYFSVGLIAFGYAVRLFVLWWGLTMLVAAWVVAHLTRDTEDAPPRVGFRLLALAACLLIVATELFRTRELRAMEGSTTHRTLPTFGALPAAGLAQWLESNTRTDARGKILTSFAFGSYLTWRLPRYATSIDSRGLPPDSVAAAEAIVSAADRDVPVGPWMSADLAIVPVRFRVAAVLDTASGWTRLHTVPGEALAADSAALWVRDAWWLRYGTPPAPQ